MSCSGGQISWQETFLLRRNAEPRPRRATQATLNPASRRLHATSGADRASANTVTTVACSICIDRLLMFKQVWADDETTKQRRPKVEIELRRSETRTQRSWLDAFQVQSQSRETGRRSAGAFVVRAAAEQRKHPRFDESSPGSVVHSAEKLNCEFASLLVLEKNGAAVRHREGVTRQIVRSQRGASDG